MPRPWVLKKVRKVVPVTRGKDPKIRVYKGKEKKSRATPTNTPTTNHRSFPSVNSNFSLVSKVPAGHAAETLCQVAETYRKACKALSDHTWAPSKPTRTWRCWVMNVLFSRLVGWFFLESLLEKAGR